MFRLKVKEIADAKRVSQRQLFLNSKVDITTIRKVFHDPYTVVTVDTLERMAEVLKVDVSQLIESVPEKLVSDLLAIEEWERQKEARKRLASGQPVDNKPDSNQPDDDLSDSDQLDSNRLDSSQSVSDQSGSDQPDNAPTP